MSTLSTFRLTFHVSHPSLPASEIENIFKLPTRYSKSVGMPKKTNRGRLIGGEYKRTSVSFLLHKDPLNFNDVSVVDLIKKQLKSYDQDYLDEILKTGGSCHFLMGIFTSGNVMVDFNADIIHCLSSSKIGIKFDFYGGED